jgi:tetratricopeptide (TPR) repeat protein
LAGSPAWSQSAEEFYKGKQLRLIIGNPAGGDYDLGGRTLARFLPSHLPGNPTIVVQNMPGASTIVAANHLYNVAPRDGTYMLVVVQTVATDQVLERAPNDASAWSNRGNVLLALGDAPAAIADQERAMALAPLHPDPHLNRGTAEEALGRWQAAAADYRWILERDPTDASALYNLGNVMGSLGDWSAARDDFAAAADARPGFAMARSSAALAAFQLGELDVAEQQLRSLIRRYPLFADARAGLTALLWRRGARGEAESNWAAASGLDSRYRQRDWLSGIRRWPPRPVEALGQFLALDS